MTQRFPTQERRLFRIVSCMRPSDRLSFNGFIGQRLVVNATATSLRNLIVYLPETSRYEPKSLLAAGLYIQAIGVSIVC